MICHCFGKTFNPGALARATRQTALLMLGVPDYDAYVAHMRDSHPAQAPATRNEFFAACQQARFGAGKLRCC